jgi:hypothetical protein
MSEDRPAERRRYPRYRVRCVVRYAASGFESEAHVTQISLAGLLLEHEVVAEIGDILPLAIQLSPELALEAEAKVLYVRPGFGTGFQFVRMSDQALVQLEGFLKQTAAGGVAIPEDHTDG